MNILKQKGVDAKIHYPTSMHLQPAAKVYGYKKGDFPIAEMLSDTSISLPVHEFVTKKFKIHVKDNSRKFKLMKIPFYRIGNEFNRIKIDYFKRLEEIFLKENL